MCCITHNKLVLGVTFISIALGIFILITSSYIIHYQEDLESQTTHFRHLLACACFTLGTGTVQTISSLCFLSRKISTQRWISINAMVFLVVILGIVITMSHFSMLPPPKPTHSSLSAEFQNSTLAFQNLTLSNQTQLDNENSMESDEVSMGGSSGEVNSDPDDSVEMVTDPGDHISDSGEEDVVISHVILLRFYFTSLLSNCLAVPIFLGLVASKASKYELRGKKLLDNE